MNNFRAKRWTFTVNNPCDDEFWVNYIDGCEDMDLRYVIWMRWQLEEETTPHVQGYVIMKSATSLSSMKKKLPFARAHLEASKGTLSENEDYCTKEDSRVRGPWSYGEEPDFTVKQGERTDLVAIANMFRDDTEPMDIYEANPTRYITSKKYFKLLPDPSVLLSRQDGFRNVEVIFIWGPPGSGKSRIPRERYENHRICKCISYNPEWWNETYMPKCLLLDELEWNSVRIPRLNDICDGYEFSLPIKGGHVSCARVETVYLISNFNLMTHWENSPMLRRITQVIHKE